MKHLSNIQKEYDEQIIKLKEIIYKKNIKKINYRDFSVKFGLRDSRWFIRNCNNPKVKNFNTFLEFEVGVMPNYMASREKILDIIRKKMLEKGSQLYRKDFDDGFVGISTGTIVRTFGSIKNLNAELGLHIHRGGMDKKLKIEEIKDEIRRVLPLSKSYIITISEFDELSQVVKYATASKRLKSENGISFREYINTLGYELVKPGMGYVFEFDDGEVVQSSYEYQISSLLRVAGYSYGKDYLRNVKYKDILKTVSENITADYYFPEKNLLVEIAGILRDYRSLYLRGELPKSGSKSKYATTLMKKEKYLISGNFSYIIFIPEKYNYKKVMGDVMSAIKSDSPIGCVF